MWQEMIGVGSIEAMVNHAVNIANDDSHGYSWADRWNVDRDCSSLMYDSADAGGYPVGRGVDKVRYTGTMLEDFTAVGFEAIPFYNVGLDGLIRGDILLNVEHHTEMYIGDGLMVGAHIAETGDVYGEPGDQTGNEISIGGAYIYWDGWDYVLRPPADSEPEPEPEPEQIPGKPVNDADMWYRAHVQDLGWCDPVRDGQVAGTVGFGKRLEAIKLTPPPGYVLDVAVHVANVGWKHYRGIERGVKDPIIGTVGKGNAIESVLITVTARPNGDKRKLKFRVHQANTGWKAWTKEGFASGSDGLSIQLEAIQIKIV